MAPAKIDLTPEREKAIEARYSAVCESALRGGPADLATIEPLLARIVASEEPGTTIRLTHREGPPSEQYPCHYGSAEWWVHRYRLAQEFGVEYDREDALALADAEILAFACGGVVVSAVVEEDGHPVVLMDVHDRPTVHIVETPSGPMLHREAGPAIEYPGGSGLYALWDISIPDDLSWVATLPRAELAERADDIMAIESADVRRVAIRRCGVAPMLTRLGAKEVHRDSVTTAAVNADGTRTGETATHPYVLYEVKLPGAQRPSRALHMLYPSGPHAGTPLVEWVPPWVKTCGEARAWRLHGGSDEAEFRAWLKSYLGDPGVLT